MTTEFMTRFDRLVPRGTLVRFGIAGGFNSVLFFFSWTALMAAFSSADVRLLWGLCWGATGVLAHFVHRSFTFDNRKPVRWTLTTALPVYFTSLAGSSITIGWLASAFPGQLYWMGAANLLAWGVIIWLMMRWLVFQFTPTPHASQALQAE